MRIQSQRNKQAAVEIGGLGTSSHGRCQGQAIDEGRWIRVLADESRGPAQSGVDRRSIEVAIELGRREVIGAAEKGAGVGQLRARGENRGEGRFRRPRVTTPTATE